MKSLRYQALALAVLAGLSFAGVVVAQSAAPTPAQQKELDAARAELDRAAKRYGELARKYRGLDGKPMNIEHHLLRRPVLGVLLAPDATAGVRIAGVTPESAAAEAGLKSGDRLLAIDGRQILGSDAELRVDNARSLLRDLESGKQVKLDYQRGSGKASVSVAPRPGSRMLLLPEGDARDLALGQFDVEIDHEAIRNGVDDAMRMVSMQGPHLDKELMRLGQCKDKDGDCDFPVLTEAFRWSGLNLSSLDPELGRYFGTDDGVLVLSAGDELQGLRAGDVVQKIDGRKVETPREAMAALRARPADSSVRVDYLRDRKPGTAQVKVPKVTPFRIPMPPPPPAPPAPPAAPPSPSTSAIPPAPPAAPPPPDAPRAVQQRRIVLLDDEAMAGREVEMRRMVFVDRDGKTTVLEGDDAPPPPPAPAPPPPPPAPPVLD